MCSQNGRTLASSFLRLAPSIALCALCPRHLFSVLYSSYGRSFSFFMSPLLFINGVRGSETGSDLRIWALNGRSCFVFATCLFLSPFILGCSLYLRRYRCIPRARMSTVMTPNQKHPEHKSRRRQTEAVSRSPGNQMERGYPDNKEPFRGFSP